MCLLSTNYTNQPIAGQARNDTSIHHHNGKWLGSTCAALYQRRRKNKS